MSHQELNALTGQALLDELHELIKSAKRRVWIASPYIGSWQAVSRILGSGWENVGSRLLIDKESGGLAKDTLQRFSAHRPIRSLTGLHAKLYIADDSVLLTSANLTEHAFIRRHEVGLLLKGQQAKELIGVYEGFWKLGQDVDLQQVNFSKAGKGSNSESRSRFLPKLFNLPPSVDAKQQTDGAFADYEYFLEQYDLFTKVYISCGGRDQPDVDIYFETDKFLNFLFHHDLEPSKKYALEAPRSLSDAERMKEIKKYRTLYRKADFPGEGDHTRTSKLIRRYLSTARVMQLTKTEIKLISGKLNCFGNRRTLSRFLNAKGNSPAAVRKAWADLVRGHGSPTVRMNNCKHALFGFGKSATQELLAYYNPKHFPLRNQNTNAGLRFLGYNIRAR